jgi:ankyrin repeat protein
MLVSLCWSRPVFGGEIHNAARDGNLGKVRALILGNPELVSRRDDYGVTPDMRRGLVQLLLADDKAQVITKQSSLGLTPLHVAAVMGHKNVAELLLANRAEVNAKRGPIIVIGLDIGSVAAPFMASMKAPMARGAGKNNLRLYERLVALFPEDLVPAILVLLFHLDETPLHLAAQEGHKDLVELLLANGADVNAESSFGLTSLHVAVEHKDVVELLLANKVEINAKASDGETPLHMVSKSDHKDVVELLLANRAEVNAKANDGRTPLHYAADTGHKEVVELLLANKAEVNAKANDGRTPLHYAPDSGHKDVAELLLANRAEVNAKTNHGETPLLLALKSGHKDMVELLRQHSGHK